MVFARSMRVVAALSGVAGAMAMLALGWRGGFGATGVTALMLVATVTLVPVYMLVWPLWRKRSRGYVAAMRFLIPVAAVVAWSASGLVAVGVLPAPLEGFGLVGAMWVAANMTAGWIAGVASRWGRPASVDVA